MNQQLKKVMFSDFSENPYPEMEEQMRLIEECGPEVYFKNITQAAFSSETNEEIWDLVQEKIQSWKDKFQNFIYIVRLLRKILRMYL